MGGRNIPTEIVLSMLRTARTARDDDDEDDDDDDDDSSIISVLSCPVNSDRHTTKKKHENDDEAIRIHTLKPPTNHKKTKSTTTQRHGAAFSFTFLSQLLQKNRRRSLEDHEKRR